MARRRPSNREGEANASPFLVMLCAFLALGIALYPLVSNAYNERHRSQIQTAYTAYVEELDTAETDAEREAAEAYNAALVPGVAFTREALLRASEQYDGLLNVRGDGTMGYLEIPKLDVELPILHGTEEESLSRGVGHLLGTSLPVGGANTNAVLAGHRGWKGAAYFRDIELLQVGDRVMYEGFGAPQIATYLNNLSYRARSGKMWHHASIRGIIICPKLGRISWRCE